MNYKPRLDGLRCIAILMVLLEHFVYFIGSKITGGFYGVNLFFCLSGFLITSILINQKGSFKESYLKFLGRRTLRIFPVYYFMIFFLWIFNVPGIKNDIVYLLTYTYNYRLGTTGDWSSIYTPYWSLSVEEQFYLFFPIIALMLTKRLKWLLGVCGFFIIVGYLQLVLNVFDLKRFDYVGLLSNMATLALGASGAILVKLKKIPNRMFRSKVFEILLFILLPITLLSSSWMLKILLCPILNFLIVIKAAAFHFSLKPIDDFLKHKIPIFIGKISYGMYVYHLVISYFFVQYFFNPLWKKIPFPSEGLLSKIYYNDWLLRFPLLCLFTIGFSWLSFNYFERPILQYKEKLFKYQ